MKRTPSVRWIDPKKPAKDVIALALRVVAADGVAVLRARNKSGERMLAKVAANLPTGFDAVRSPTPPDETVTTLVVYPAGTSPPFFWDPDV